MFFDMEVSHLEQNMYTDCLIIGLVYKSLITYIHTAEDTF